MSRRLQRAIATILVGLTVAACGSAASTASPSPSALTFAEYSAVFCSAWESLFTAVGNPDSGSGSELSKSFDEAVASGDAATVERLAATITTTLELARQVAAAAGGWPTAQPMMAQMDRFIVAYETMIAAKRAGKDGQAAFVQAGGVVAWTAMFKAYAGVARPSGTSQANCPKVPIAP
jgi:hypothetical protein